ncbi:MAG: XTP/dITP diphosphatase [Clostridia bacterium]|nr:XTP/dITP diphosphatase [Clostridia bacterium]
MKAVLASHNKHKIGELQAILAKHIPDIEILSLSDVGLEGEIVEDGATFEENALIKASFAARSGFLGIGDDSGLCVTALGGAPGIYSARYSGEDADDKKNNEKLLSELGGKSDRSAKFVCCIACVFPDGRRLTVRGETHGIILESADGEGGFGYDPLFYVPELGKTYALMGAEEKNAISHRGRAIERLADEIKNFGD